MAAADSIDKLGKKELPSVLGGEDDIWDGYDELEEADYDIPDEKDIYDKPKDTDLHREMYNSIDDDDDDDGEDYDHLDHLRSNNDLADHYHSTKANLNLPRN